MPKLKSSLLHWEKTDGGGKLDKQINNLKMNSLVPRHSIHDAARVGIGTIAGYKGDRGIPINAHRTTHLLGLSSCSISKMCPISWVAVAPTELTDEEKSCNKVC